MDIRPKSHVLIGIKDNSVLIRKEKTSLSEKLEKEIKNKEKKLDKRNFDREFYEEVENTLKDDELKKP